MKYLNPDGTVSEGTPLTDRQVNALDRFEAYLHERVCSNSYHGTYSKKPCKEAAIDLIPKLDDSAIGSLLRALFEPEVELETKPEEN